MNAHAVTVERGYGRPIMSAFHGYASLGALAGALGGVLSAQLGLSIKVYFPVVPTSWRPPPRGRAGLYWRSGRTCTVGPVMILIASLMMCSISLPILRFCSWRGIACGTRRAPRRAGVDGQSAYYVQAVLRVEEFLDRLRTALRDRSFCPVPVRERMIPKAGGKQRRLGIATVTDRVVHAFLTEVWEAILEADFLPCTTVSIPDVALMTRSPRPAIWRFSPMSGSSRVTSRRAPMRL
jgi:hypothetical protein